MRYNQREVLFATGKIFPLIVRFSIPTVIGMIITALNTFIDRIYVGNIPGDGAMSIAGVNVAMPITFIMFAFTMLAAMGGGANISLKLGEGDREGAAKFAGNGMFIGFVANMVVCAVLLIFLEPIFRLFGVSNDVMPYAKEYTKVLIWCNLPYTLGFIMNRYILAQGFPKLSMLTNIISVAINAVLDPVFIFVFGWGIKGAAWATAIAQAMILVIMLFFFKKKSVTVKVKFKYMLHPEANYIKRILALGVAQFAIQIVSACVQMIYTSLFGKYGGDEAVAAFGIVFSILNLVIMPIFGINQGVTPIIGFNYGAQLYSRVKKLLLTTIIFAGSVAAVVWAAQMIFARAITSAFGATPEVVDLAAYALRIIVMVLPVAAVQIIGGNYFQAVGKPIKAMLLSTSRQTFILIPLLYILPNFFGLDGIYYAMPTADIVAATITFSFVILELRKLKKLSETEIPFKDRKIEIIPDA